MKHPIARYDDFGLEFETVGDAAEAGAGGAPAPAPAATPAPAGDPAPGWAGPSQAEWQDTQQFLGFIANALQEPDDQGAPAAVTPPPADEPLTAASVQAMIDERAAAIASEQVGAYAPILNEIAAERGKALVKTELTNLMADPAVGEFQGTDHATAIAQGLLASGIPAEQALRQAAIQQAQFERELRGTAAQGERQQIANRVATTPEANAAGQAAHEITKMPARDDQGRDRYQQLADNWAEGRRTQGSPVG